MFFIRGLQLTNVVERMFCAETADERYIVPTMIMIVIMMIVSPFMIVNSDFRHEWLSAIDTVASRISSGNRMPMGSRSRKVVRDVM